MTEQERTNLVEAVGYAHYPTVDERRELLGMNNIAVTIVMNLQEDGSIEYDVTITTYKVRFTTTDGVFLTAPGINVTVADMTLTGTDGYIAISNGCNFTLTSSEVKGTVNVTGGANATLIGCTVGDNLAIDGATTAATTYMEGVTVGDNVMIANRFGSEQDISLIGCKIGNDVAVHASIGKNNEVESASAVTEALPDQADRTLVDPRLMDVIRSI